MNAEQIAATCRDEAERLRYHADVLDRLARLLATPARRGRPPKGPDLGDRYAAAVAAESGAGAEIVSLHVQTTGTPESELEGREVAYTTESPAG